MGKALGLLLIVVASGLFIYWFVMPLFIVPVARPAPAVQTANAVAAQPDAANLSPSAATKPTVGRQPVPDVTSLPPPRTPEQKAQDDLEAKRAPYYRWLRDQAGDRINDVRLADDDRSALILYTSIDSPEIVTALVRDVVLPAAYKYGFRQVRFFVPNPAGNVSQYRYYAESTADADGNWHTFLK
jgi:hypothetical protein